MYAQSRAVTTSQRDAVVINLLHLGKVRSKWSEQHAAPPLQTAKRRSGSHQPRAQPLKHQSRVGACVGLNACECSTSIFILSGVLNLSRLYTAD